MNTPTHYRIAFAHAQWFKDIRDGIDGTIDDETVARTYAETVRSALGPLAKAGTLESHRRGPSEVGGDGLFIDWVDVFLKAGAAYAIVRKAAKDIRKVAREVAKRTGRQAYIDSDAAVLLAISESLANGSKDIEPVSATALERATERRIGAPPSAYVVNLIVDGVARLVVVNADCTIVGSTSEHPYTYPDPATFAEYEFGLGGIGSHRSTAGRKKAPNQTP
jgi:hypothetical protein